MFEDMSIIWISALVGGLAGGVVMFFQVKAQNKAFEASKSKVISLDEFNALEEGSYEMVFIGSEEQYKELGETNFKFVQFKLGKIKKATRRDLPFDADKIVVVATPNPAAIIELEQASQQYSLDYRPFNDYKELNK